jgi:ADP-heptose:LPS heptosyltransferase
MTILLQNLKSLLLRIFCFFYLPKENGKEGNTLVFMDMGIGNAVWMIPTLRGLKNLYIDCPNKELREILHENIDFKDYDENETYTHCIANFLVQRNQEIYKIIKHRIPNRIGHDSRKKYRWVFNTLIDFSGQVHELHSNENLTGILDICGIKLPKSGKKYKHYDILIQAHSSFDSRKNYPHYRELIKKLKGYKIGMIGSKREFDTVQWIVEGLGVDNLCGKYTLAETCRLMSYAKLVIGNDGGLVKLADQIGVDTIQVFRHWTDSFARASVLYGTNLIEPTIEELWETLENIIHTSQV